ncbi:MAG TPA: MOSC N-terminal beta barrel domain-containing protein [Pyrinomonadaceae bacterium]|jgi:hypothetical protein
MFLSEINIYPVKSLKGTSLNSSLIEDRGLQHDRRWLLVDEKRQFLTQREFPQMAKFCAIVEDDSLNFSFEENNLKVALNANSEKTETVKIWSSSVKAKYYNDQVNDWFSEQLQTKCSLVVMPEESKRIVNPIYAVRKFEDTVSFADGYPFLLIGENSLTDLNEKLVNVLPMNRFRPNFVVSDTEAFAEDAWKKIKIGATVFHVVKSCDRCSMTTIDQETGEKDGAEPLKTLSNYRKKNGKVLFGRYLIAENVGETVKVGDKVEILETAKSTGAS